MDDASKPVSVSETAPAAQPETESVEFMAKIRGSVRGFFYSNSNSTATANATQGEGHKSLDVSKPVSTETDQECAWRKKTSSGFVGDMREFFYTPVEEHKACIKAQYHKLTAKFGKGSDVLKEGEKSH